MLPTKSLQMLLGIGLILLMVGCISASSTLIPEAPTSSLAPPTPNPSPVQNTSTPVAGAKVKFILPPSPDHRGEVVGLAFSPDGKVLASLHKNGRIILWDVATGQSIQSLAGGGETGELGMMPGFTFSPDGKSLVSKSNGGTPMLWDIVGGQSIEVESGLQRSNGMALSADGKMLAYGKCAELDSWSHCSQYEIILWDVATRQPVGQSLLFNVSAPAPLGLLFSPDGKTLAVMSSGTTGSGRIELFDVVAHQSIISPFGGEVSFSSMAFSPKGRYLMLGGIGGVIHVWDIETHEVVSNLIGETCLVTGMAFSPDGKRLASRILIPSTENIPHEKIVLWNMDNLQAMGQPLTGQAATGREVGLISIAFSPDNTTLASGTDDGDIILWDLSTSLP